MGVRAWDPGEIVRVVEGDWEFTPGAGREQFRIEITRAQAEAEDAAGLCPCLGCTLSRFLGRPVTLG